MHNLTSDNAYIITDKMIFYWIKMSINLLVSYINKSNIQILRTTTKLISFFF